MLSSLSMFAERAAPSASSAHTANVRVDDNSDCNRLLAA